MRLRIRALAVVLGLTPLWAQSARAATRPSCSRACLTRVMDSYMAHLLAHDPTGLPLAAKVENRENTRKLAVGEGLWKLAKAVKARQTFADPVTGNVVAWTAIQLSDDRLAQVSIRLALKNGKITEIETGANTGMLAANPGSPYPGGPYNAENVLEQDVLYMAPVPPERRSTRADLIKTADSYFEAIGRHDASAFKYGSRCERYESGARGTNQMRRNADQSAAQGAFSGDCGTSLTNLRGQQTINRRYPVVDTELGVVIGYMFIMHRERTPPADNWINEMFKIVDGKVRQIDAVGFFQPGIGDSGFPDDPKLTRLLPGSAAAQSSTRAQAAAPRVLASVPGDRVENVVEADDGALYFTGVFGGQVLKRAPDAAQSIFFKVHSPQGVLQTPTGFLVDYQERDPDFAPGKMSFKGLGARIALLDSHAQVLKILSGPDEDAFYNGIASAGGGVYYIADSGAGRLLEADIAAGTVKVWLDSPMTHLPPGSPFGPNGMKVHDGWVYYSRGDIYRVKIGADGRPVGDAVLAAKTGGTDDFDIAADGTIYASHASDVLKATSGGEVSVFSDGGCPMCTAVRLSRDGRSIYLTGGSFPGRGPVVPGYVRELHLSD